MKSNHLIPLSIVALNLGLTLMFVWSNQRLAAEKLRIENEIGALRTAAVKSTAIERLRAEDEQLKANLDEIPQLETLKLQLQEDLKRLKEWNSPSE